jgi:hypothetical protein
METPAGLTSSSGPRVVQVGRIGCLRLPSWASSGRAHDENPRVRNHPGRRVAFAGSSRPTPRSASCAAASRRAGIRSVSCGPSASAHVGSPALRAGHLHLHMWAPLPFAPGICICTRGLPRPSRRGAALLPVDGRIRLAGHLWMSWSTGAFVVENNLARRKGHVAVST